MNEIFLDTETTGLSFLDNHKIVEIACIETKDLIPTNKIFHQLINPQRDVPPEASKIHGYSSEFLKDKKIFKDIVEEFLIFIKDKRIIIHNASFDLGFLNHELRLIKREDIKKENIIDSLEIARAKFPGSPNSLDALCKRFNIDLSRRVKHNALLDCELLREVYINLLDVKEPKLIFSNDSGKNKVGRNINDNVYSKKIIKISETEKKTHNIFLKKEMNKNFY